MTAMITRANPADLLEALGTGRLLRLAQERGVTLSDLLDEELPRDEKARSPLDGFGQLMKAAGIRTRDVPSAGIVASTMEDFNRDAGTRLLFAEWAWRIVRSVKGLSRDGLAQAQRALMTSSDAAAGSALNQIVFAAEARFKQIAPAVPIAEVVAQTTPIDGGTYEAFYLTDVTAQERRVRVAEGAEIPVAKLTGGDQVIRLKKYGRGIAVTYEQIRRQKIDVLALHIARISVQNEVDKLATIIDVAVNGDGNASTAATSYNLTTLDSAATAGTLTLKGWLTFKAKFRNPYQLGVVLAQEAVVVQLQTLNVGSANVPLVVVQGAQGLGNLTPINNELGDTVRFGLTDDAPTLKIVGLDNRFAIERVVERNSDISETARWVQNQLQVLYFTENEGYKTYDQNAIKILDVNA